MDGALSFRVVIFHDRALNYESIWVESSNKSSPQPKELLRAIRLLTCTSPSARSLLGIPLDLAMRVLSLSIARTLLHYDLFVRSFRVPQNPYLIILISSLP